MLHHDGIRAIASNRRGLQCGQTGQPLMKCRPTLKGTGHMKSITRADKNRQANNDCENDRKRQPANPWRGNVDDGIYRSLFKSIGTPPVLRCRATASCQPPAGSMVISFTP